MIRSAGATDTRVLGADWMAVTEHSRPAMSPMFRMALVSGSAAAVLLHLRRGADRDGRDGAGSTPLMIAAARGRLEVCELLIAEGADIRATDAAGRDALALAKAGRHQRLEDLLGTLCPTPVAAPLPPAPAVPVKATFGPSPVLVEDEDLGNAGVWEPEAETVRPANDTALADQAAGVQLTLASHRAVDHDADWSDVVVELPAPVIYRRDDPVLRRQFERLATLLGVGLIEGAVAEGALESAFVPTAGEAAEPARIRLEAAGLAFADLGIRLDEDRAWRAGGCTSRASASVSEDVRSFIESVEAAADVLGPYYRELARQPRLSSEEEQRLWRSMDEETVRLGAAALAAPALLPPLLAELERQSAAAAGAAERRQGFGQSDETEAATGGEVAVGEARVQLIGLLTKQRDEGSAGLHQDLRSRSALLRLFGRLHPSPESLSSLCRAVLTVEECGVAGAVLDRVTRIRAQATVSHLKLVIWWARRYSRRGLELADLIQEGSIGLMRATERYEWVRGHRFSTYASWWIRQAITRGLADGEHLIRRPVHLGELLSRVSRTRTTLAVRLQRKPTLDELATEVGAPADRLGRILARLSEVVPLDEVAEEEGGTTINDVAIPAIAFGAIAQTELRAVMTQAFACLSPREERILRLRFGFNRGADHTLEECGEMFGVTRERIRQIEAKALRKLKTPAGARRLLRTFVDV